MEQNHMHNVISLFVFFILAGLFTFLCVQLKNLCNKVNRNKCKYGNLKVGDVITPKEIKHD